MEIGTLNLDCFEKYRVDLRINFTLTQFTKDKNVLSDDNLLTN